MKAARRPRELPPLHLVLWGHYSDELVAATFVVTLRQAGLLTKLVAMGGRKQSGAHGLALVPDLTVGEALQQAAHIACLIFTASELISSRQLNEPRLLRLLQLAATKRACFVVPQATQKMTNEFFPDLHNDQSPLCTKFYPMDERLVAFVEALAKELKGSHR